MLFNTYLFISLTIAVLTIISHKLEENYAASHSVDTENDNLWYINMATLAVIPSILFIGIYAIFCQTFNSINLRHEKSKA